MNAANKKVRSVLSCVGCHSADVITESQILVMDNLLSHGGDVLMQGVTGKAVLDRAQIEGRTQAAGIFMNWEKCRLYIGARRSQTV